MMKFLKLLDPYQLPKNDITAPGKQQRRAAELFPNLVAQSRLNYWRPGDPVPKEGNRYLVGLAASFNLMDLRLADIINDQLSLANSNDYCVDVFNVEDFENEASLSLYFSIQPEFSSGWHSTPLVGKWSNGEQVTASSMTEARKFILDELGCDITVEESTANLNPPARSLMED